MIRGYNAITPTRLTRVVDRYLFPLDLVMQFQYVLAASSFTWLSFVLVPVFLRLLQHPTKIEIQQMVSYYAVSRLTVGDL